jgi:C-terminal processing protease CtpA/Prc
MLNKFSCFLVITIIFFSSAISNAEELSEPERNFEHLWNEFDKRYALFLPKRVDWRLLYKVYRPRVTSQTTDDALFDIMSSMLAHLNDFHVSLDSHNPARSFRSGKSYGILIERFGTVENFLTFLRQRPLDKRYIKGELHERHGNIFAYAWLADDVGYFHFNQFRDIDQSSQVIDEIVDYFENAKGLIIDVRRNVGGDDRVGRAIADRFADKKRLYMMIQAKNGPHHDDFAEPVRWYVEPDGPIQFTKPVILLMDVTSLSAAENFALAIRVLPHATTVGDFTSGCFADAEVDTLPNGWSFSISVNLFVDRNGFCWEGIGIPPDFRIINTNDDLEDRRDLVLEFAVDLINSGAIKTYEKEREYPVEW